MLFIAHHGVKGQKWGVRRYQNYDGTLTYAGRKRFGYTDSRNGQYKLKSYTSPSAYAAKSVALQVASQAAAMLIPGYSWVHNAMVLKNRISNSDFTDYTKKEGTYERISDLPKKTESISAESDMLKVNQRLGKQKGKIHNCGYCSVAMEMRRRGYDVVARSKAQGITDTDLNKWYENVKLESPNITKDTGEKRKDYVNRAYNQVCNNLEKYGDGARGYLSFSYQNMNSGHACW